MKRRFQIVLALVVLLFVGFFSGPRIDLSYTPEPLALPARAIDLPAYLEQAEAAIPHLKPGTEKYLSWAGTPGQKTALSLVYFPGFSATHQETQPLPRNLAKALGANAFYTRFRGHGRDGQAMLEGSVNHWLNDAQEALEIGKKIGDRVILMGVSTGASIATIMAAEAQTELKAMLFISPNYGLKDPKSILLTWPWGTQMAKLFIGEERSWEPESEAESKYWTWKYPTPAIMPMMGIVQRTQSLNYAELKTPVMMVYSPADQIISPDQVQNVFAQWGAQKKTLWAYEKSTASAQHVLAGDIKAPESTPLFEQRMLEFIQGLN